MKKLYKSILSLLAITALLVVGAVAFSPYGKQDGRDYALLKETVTINASAEEVFAYLGNSANAEEWSVFVDHIEALNADQVPDGQIGSKRRCYQNADEVTDAIWDEEILLVEQDKQRRLLCYNMEGFAMSTDHLLTEQLYESNGPNQCTVSFTLYFEPGTSSWYDELKMYLGAYIIAGIFEDNLENIKKFNEQ